MFSSRVKVVTDTDTKAFTVYIPTRQTDVKRKITRISEKLES